MESGEIERVKQLLKPLFVRATRYPNGLPEITPREAFFKEDAEACLESAGAIFQKVRALIS
jgi:HEPN domain-containing protein